MEKRFFLRLEGECPWQSAVGECFPAPEDFEVILFSYVLEHGLLMLVSRFMEGLLYYYKIQPTTLLHSV